MFLEFKTNLPRGYDNKYQKLTFDECTLLVSSRVFFMNTIQNKKGNYINFLINKAYKNSANYGGKLPLEILLDSFYKNNNLIGCLDKDKK